MTSKNKKALSCQGCKKALGKKYKRVKCGGKCGFWFHGTEICTELTQRDLKKVIDKKQEFVCNSCGGGVNLGASEGEDGSSFGDTSDSEDEISDSRKCEEGTGRRSTAGREYSLRDVMMKLENMQEENRRLFQKLEKQEQETKQIKKKMEEMKQEQAKMRQEIDSLKNDKQRNIENSLKNNIVISGLPINGEKNEQLKSKFQKIAEKLEVSLENEEFQCVAIGKENKKHLKVIFEGSKKKEEIMKAKKNISIRLNDIGYNERTNVYINHDMSYENQELFKKVRDFKKENNFKYAWYAHGNIYLKELENSKAIHVKSLKTLEGLKN